MSRQNYYAARRLRQRRQIDEAMIVELVRRERRMQPRLGGRKLLHWLRGDLSEAGVSVGRDRFFELLAESDLLVVPKPGAPRTTNSRHSLPVFGNLLVGKVLCAPNEVWVSDLRYIRTDEGFLYAALITDAYSRKIVGAHIGDSLEAEGCLRALDQALKTLPAGKQPIHHSDRGCQYCCHEYVERLQARGLAISMTHEVQHLIMAVVGIRGNASETIRCSLRVRVPVRTIYAVPSSGDTRSFAPLAVVSFVTGLTRAPNICASAPSIPAYCPA